MEFEFDKEMDALLRQAARGEIVSANPKSEIRNPKSFHLDADAISLFAENGLPEKLKAIYSEHFAGCDRCRKILSNVISLNAENSMETVHAPQKTAIAATLPWYKSLFAVPNLAPAMGALVLVFAGLVAFTFLKSSSDSQNAEIALQTESTEKMSGPNAGGDTQIIESNAAMSNGGSMRSSSSMSNFSSSASNAAAATNTAAASATNNGSMSNGASDSAANVSKQMDKRSETAKNEARNAADSVVVGNNNTVSDMTGASFSERKKETLSDEKMRAREDKETIQSDAPAPKSAAPTATRSTPAELRANGRTASSLNSVSAKKSKSDASEKRAAGGKTFKRENGVWYDSAYGGQATINVRRASADYKKLASGLRSIAESLSGTIVVVFDGKVYRIQ